MLTCRSDAVNCACACHVSVRIMSYQKSGHWNAITRWYIYLSSPTSLIHCRLLMDIMMCSESAFRRSFSHNLQDIAKHRKRTRENDIIEICMCSCTLFGCLQAMYWKRPRWKDFMLDVENLALLLSKYGEYLVCNETGSSVIATSS